MFEQALEQARVKYEFLVYGYVLMPEHVHLLVGGTGKGDTRRGTESDETIGRAPTS